MTPIWRINLKPSAEEGIDPRAFFLQKAVLGVGWAVETNRNDVNYETYDRLARKAYPHDNGRSPATNALKYRMALNDLCWTRDKHKVYFLGRITDEWEYRGAPDYRAADIVNVRKCDWLKVGKVDAVPGKVLNSFVPNRTL